jgi:hypothetical protein
MFLRAQLTGLAIPRLQWPLWGIPTRGTPSQPWIQMDKSYGMTSYPELTHARLARATDRRHSDVTSGIRKDHIFWRTHHDCYADYILLFALFQVELRKACQARSLKTSSCNISNQQRNVSSANCKLQDIKEGWNSTAMTMLNCWHKIQHRNWQSSRNWRKYI